MKSFLLCGIAIASVLMLQPAPASAQRVHGAGQARMGIVTRVTALGDFNIIIAAMRAATGPGTALELPPQPWRRGLIGGAIATQNQGYTTPTRIIPATRTSIIPAIRAQGTCIATLLSLRITTAIPSRTANRLTDDTTPPVGAISATTGFDMLAHDWL